LNQNVLKDFNIKIKYIKRSNRATIKLLPDKVIALTVPAGVSADEVHQLLLKKQDWILKRYKILESRPAPVVLKFTSDEVFPFYGEQLTLKIIEGVADGVIKSGNILYVCGQNPKALLIKWYQARALEKIKLRVQYFADLLQVQPKSIAIKNYKSRWGACSSKGELILNWQIIGFAPELFDYVIAHEICHLKEMNHSSRFYAHLQSLGFEKRHFHSQMRNLKNIF
jgi:predicted metal-dependent hydrolase